MRVLLINANLRDDILIAPPIGLCYVAAATEAAGHEVTVLDPCIRRPALRNLERSIRNAAPQVVGISVRNIDNANLLHPVSYVPGVVDLVHRVRQVTGAPIIIGGSGASLCPEAVLRQTSADFIVASHGERSFVRLLDRLADPERAHGIPGVGRITTDGRFDMTAPVVEPFSTPRADVGRWVDAAAYARRGGGYSIQTKRGCPHACIYCTYSQVLEGHTVRLRPPEEVVEEIEEALRRYRPAYFEFVDSVFNEPRDHCTTILERLVRLGSQARFTAMGIDPSNLDADLLDLMWRAGFRSFQMSPESGSQTMIRSYGKRLTRGDLERAAQALRGTRFSVLWYFLIGGPGETNQTLGESLTFVVEHLRPRTHPPYNMAWFMFGVRVYQGTALWRTAVDQGLVAADADPASPLWYCSEDLDVPLAVRQLLDAAATIDEVLLGLDERLLATSHLWTAVTSKLPIAKPYWHHGWKVNRVLRALRLRGHPDPDTLVNALRERLPQPGHTP
jgi:radical SAM superfamily enzyme YgiQ (UPF0313 family)